MKVAPINQVLQRSTSAIPLKYRSNLGLNLFLVVFGLGLGLFTASQIVSGTWVLALGLILALPGFIFLHNYPILGVIGWLILVPFLVDIDSSNMRRVYWVIHRTMPLVTIVIILVSSMLRTKPREMPKLGWVEAAMIGYVIVSLINIFTLSADATGTTIVYYDRVIIPMLLYFIVRILVRDEDSFRQLLPALLFVCITQATFGVMYVFARGLLPNVWLRTAGERATGSLSSVAVYSTTLVFTALTLMHAALNQKPRNTISLLFAGTFLLAIPALFFSFSRASWLAAVVAFLGFTYLYPKFMSRLAMIVLPVALIVAGGLLADQLDYAESRLNSERTAFSRLPIIAASFNMFEAKPLFGWGYSNFDLYDRQFQERVGDIAAPEKDHASHNLFLTVLAEQGITGLILYVAPVIGLLALSIKRWYLLPAEGLWSRKLLVIFWLVIAAHVIVNNFSNMRVVFGLGVWWMTLSLIASLLYWAAEQVGSEQQGEHQRSVT